MVFVALESTNGIHICQHRDPSLSSHSLSLESTSSRRQDCSDGSPVSCRVHCPSCKILEVTSRMSAYNPGQVGALGARFLVGEARTRIQRGDKHADK